MCSNDGHYCKALITENVHRPRGITIYPQKGTIYWTDWGLLPMIATAGMDGNFVKPLIDKDIHWPNGKFFYTKFSHSACFGIDIDLCVPFENKRFST